LTVRLRHASTGKWIDELIAVAIRQLGCNLRIRWFVSRMTWLKLGSEPLTQEPIRDILIAMSALSRRFLLTACCLVLLPQSWCSFVAVAQGCGREKKTVSKAQSSCCDLCQCGNRQEPTPEPKRPIPSSQCRCCQLDWLKPKPPQNPVVDLSLFAFLAGLEADSTRPAVQRDLGMSIPGPSTPLHLLKCVWLC
jgi:hypothetical protein